MDRHYEDEELSALAATARVEEDAHLRSCRDCAEKLEAFQLIAEALHDEAVWHTAELHTDPVPSTVATLRAFADAMAEDEAYGEEVLPELLSGSRETWMPRLEQHPEWRSAGVVRKLIEAASRAIDTMPPDAVEMTALATNVAERLDRDEYDREAIARLCGAAWRERAYALYYTGRFIDADQAVCASERHFSECLASEYDLARLGIVRALVFRAFERFEEALAAARTSSESFASFNELQRFASARLTEIHILFSRGNFETAEPILRKLAVQLEASSAADTHARVLANLAYCCRKLGKIDEAIRSYEAAASLFATLGVETEVVRVRWNVASTLAEAGRLSDAYDRLRALLPEMERLGMTSEAACNALDIAELLLARGSVNEVEQICRNAMAIFERAGVSYTAPALTALAYIREAVSQRRATQLLVRNVREYIRRLPAQPNLLFAPPPD